MVKLAISNGPKMLFRAMSEGRPLSNAQVLIKKKMYGSEYGAVSILSSDADAFDIAWPAVDQSGWPILDIRDCKQDVVMLVKDPLLG